VLEVEENVMLVVTVHTLRVLVCERPRGRRRLLLEAELMNEVKDALDAQTTAMRANMADMRKELRGETEEQETNPAEEAARKKAKLYAKAVTAVKAAKDAQQQITKINEELPKLNDPEYYQLDDFVADPGF
jgi:predicted ribosome quality control (RQC) complex YloA/Tae2 family protein